MMERLLHLGTKEQITLAGARFYTSHLVKQITSIVNIDYSQLGLGISFEAALSRGIAHYRIYRNNLVEAGLNVKFYDDKIAQATSKLNSIPLQ